MPGTRRGRDFELIAGKEITKVLFLSKENYALAEKHYHMEKIRTVEKLLKRVPIINSWNMVKRMSFAEGMFVQSFAPGSQVYGLS